MNDAPAVSFVERVGNLDSDFQQLFDEERTFINPRGQSFTFDVLHHEEIGAVLRADIVERADVRMVQRGDSPRFALKALARFRRFGKMLGQNFDGDGAVEARIAGAINLTHAARTYTCDDFVWP